MLPTKLIVNGWDPAVVAVRADQIPARWHRGFETQDLTGKTLTYNGFALLVEKDETVDQERTLYCRFRADLLGVELPTVLLLEPLAEEEA